MGNTLIAQVGRVPKTLIKSFFENFIQLEASSGILLIAATVLALIWANSPLADTYFGLWQTRMIVGIGSLELDKPLLLWINDGLMAIFFFVVGLEIKREILMGELSVARQAILPIMAALGGMVFPALIYFVITHGTAGASGWGIPMATDIAFTLGAMALLRAHAPLPLKVFVTALAIVDDVGAVLVIALFYTSSIQWGALAVAAAVLVLLVILDQSGVNRPLPYVLFGFVLWVAFVKSGVHATVAGVLLAMTIPARTRVDVETFLEATHEALEMFEGEEDQGPVQYLTEQRQTAAQAVDDASEAIESPLHRMEHELHPWVSYAILPIFALANAGIPFGGAFQRVLGSPVVLGVIAGLLIGKPLGITLLSWLSVRLGMAELPQGVGWRHVFGAAILAGIGFTMSIFIASLAFAGDGDALDAAKIGVLMASLAAGLIGWMVLRTARNSAPPEE